MNTYKVLIECENGKEIITLTVRVDSESEAYESGFRWVVGYNRFNPSPRAKYVSINGKRQIAD